MCHIHIGMNTIITCIYTEEERQKSNTQYNMLTIKKKDVNKYFKYSKLINEKETETSVFTDKENKSQ